MPFERIADAGDERLADYRLVSDPVLARTRDLFVAEGRLVVRRLLADGRFQVESILVTEAAVRDLGPLLERASATTPIYVCRLADVETIAGFHIHRGCIAIARRPAPVGLTALLRTSTTLVVLEAIANADNVGGIFRNAAAFGADGAVLSPDCCDPLYRKAIRTSMGAALAVPFAHASPWPAAIHAIRDAGFTIVALSPRPPSEPLDTFAGAPPRVALVVGAEGAGLTPAIESLADRRVRIPMAPAVDSLNVAVASGIALWALARSRGTVP